MNRPAIPSAVLEDRLIAIARRVPHEVLVPMADVLADVGLRVIEVTLDGDDALASIASLADRALCVGAGTVRSAADTRRAIDAGARFVVSPHTAPDVVTSALDAGVAVLPGALTPTEVVDAWALGASAVKLFPASVGGPDYLRSLRGPLAGIPIVPTGGVDGSNAAEYLAAGATAVGVGGWLTGITDLDEVRTRAAALRTAVAR